MKIRFARKFPHEGRGPRIESLKNFSIPTCEAFPRVWSRTRVTEMGDLTGRQNQQDAPSDRYRNSRLLAFRLIRVVRVIRVIRVRKSH
jgi:hypothetical protein